MINFEKYFRFQLLNAIFSIFFYWKGNVNFFSYFLGNCKTSFKKGYLNSNVRKNPSDKYHCRKLTKPPRPLALCLYALI